MADVSDDSRGPAAPSAFIDDLLALIGDNAEVEASNWVAEFDWLVKIRPHNVDATDFEVMTGPQSQVVVSARCELMSHGRKIRESHAKNIVRACE